MGFVTCQIIACNGCGGKTVQCSWELFKIPVRFYDVRPKSQERKDGQNSLMDFWLKNSKLMKKQIQCSAGDKVRQEKDDLENQMKKREKDMQTFMRLCKVLL